MNIELFKSIPANSITGLPEQTRLEYLESVLSLPEKIQDMLFSDSTGAYVQGLAKSNHIPSENAFKIGLAILEVAINKKQISELSTILSKELEISIDASLEMASEIDQDLFAPIQGELGAFWASGQATPVSPAPTRQADSLARQDAGNNNRTPIVNTTPASYSGLQPTKNVLDLKELNARPESHAVLLAPRDRQKDLPARPIQKTLMPGNRTVDLKNRPSTPSPYQGEGRGEVTRRPTATLHPSTPLRVNPQPPVPPVPPKRQFPLPPNKRP